VVVSLCRVRNDYLSVGVEQIDIRLIDIVDPDANPNLDFVLTDTVRLIEQLRGEGRTVLLHCVACQSRTPTVAALYGARRQGISGATALRDIAQVLPDTWPNSEFREAIERLSP
jgi:ADP-ribosyl-[dinitrogen reductase] hydrolase